MKQTEPPVVSVVIPVYNISPFLECCLTSIVNQTLENIEIICIDDGSEDNSFEIIQHFSAQDPRVRGYRQKNQGVSAARNMGIEYARGKYISFVDGDDWIDHSMLQVMAEQAEKNNSDMVICSSELHISEKSFWTFRDRKIQAAALKTEDDTWDSDGLTESRWKLQGKTCSWPYVWNKLIRKELIDKYKIRFSEKLTLGEDGVFLQTLFQYVKSVQYMKDVFYHYRYRRKNSAMANLTRSKTEHYKKHIAVVEELLREFKERDLLDANKNYVLTWILVFLYGDFLLLPVQEQKECSIRLRSVLYDYNISKNETFLSDIEKRRLRNLLALETECSGLKKIYDNIIFKFQNRILRINH